MRRFASLTLLLAACSTAAATTGPDPSAGGTDSSDSQSGSTTLDDLTAPGGTTGGSGVPTTGEGTDTLDPNATGTTSGGAEQDYEAPGPAPVGNATFSVVAGDRTLLVEAWYPADASAQAAAEAGHPIAEFVPEGPQRDEMVALLGQLSEHGQVGVREQTRSARGAASAGAGPYPLVMFSHCHGCVRFSMFTIAERLASHGFVVVAPDHTGNTLFDEPQAPLDEAFLQVRVADQRAVLDAVLDAGNSAVPEAIRGAIDATRIGAMGHSYGAATAGRLAQEDDRIVAALPIAAPVQNPIFSGTKLAEIVEPQLFVLAVEDNSIGKIGNQLIESNFDAAATPTYLVRMKDTGHWGPTDICGLAEQFDAGCGPGTRQTDGSEFVYLAPVEARAIVASYAVAFFDHHLRGNAEAQAFLQTATPPEVVEVEARL
ncbi:alpha/beta hydrolase family protein [Nannocystis bainbridge]|uniref:Dienelactone hydrolase family protein n=1 Tax=Nannocystis bainbridge TaxID=2995303 RepID=A0ABT5E1B2_9BACT|nr:dienelactone hydrolase family protein [Nannocystis bainbridge]MDC0719218.1 dienelactone hydrolase family protein [Nannocystis bainbridge]